MHRRLEYSLVFLNSKTTTTLQCLSTYDAELPRPVRRLYILSTTTIRYRTEHSPRKSFNVETIRSITACLSNFYFSSTLLLFLLQLSYCSVYNVYLTTHS